MSSDIPAGIPKTTKTYDHLFKEMLQTIPSPHIIAFLNSIFKHEMPPSSIIEPLKTEFNTGDRKIADYIIKVTEPNGLVRYFHMEAQTKNDKQMAFRMVEYGIRFALECAKDDSEEDNILIEFPNAVVFYLKDTPTTPQTLKVTIKAPDGQELCYTIPTERMSDYTPVTLLEQNKFPLFPFYMANFNGKDPDRFQREWRAGCAKLHEFVAEGRMELTEAQKLLEGSSIVIKKAKHPNEKEVLREMESMFEVVGVGIDWLELKRQKEAAIAEARAEEREAAERQRIQERRKMIAMAKMLLEMGSPPEKVADLSGLSMGEIMALAESESQC